MEIAKRMARVISELGWQSKWTSKGNSALHLRKSSIARIQARPKDKPLTGFGEDLFVTPEELAGYSTLAQDSDLLWNLQLWCFPPGYSDDSPPPVWVSCGVEGAVVVNSEDRDSFVDTTGLVKFMFGGVKGVDFDYQHINEKTLPFYLKAYALSKELWHLFGADCCYGRHEKVAIDSWVNSEASRQFQFSYSEPVRLLRPLEDGRVPTPEEITPSSVIHPGLWGQAKGRIDLQPGEWSWEPQGLASLEFPKSKAEWERRSFPTPWNKSP